MDEPSKIQQRPDWLMTPHVVNDMKLVFVGNPVFIMATEWPEFADIGDYVISADGEEIFRGRYSAPFSADISGVLESYAVSVPDTIPEGDSPLIELGMSFIKSVQVQLVPGLGAVGTSPSNTIALRLLPGGISKQNLRKYIAADTDVFVGRFLNRKGNFFLSVRTHSWIVPVRETELAPLYFLASEGDELQARCVVSGASLKMTVESSGMAALHPVLLRRKFATECGVWPAVLDIVYNGSVGCRLVIEAASAARERYILRFRNSLGVFERLELAGNLSTGIMPYEAEEDAGERTYRRFDSDVQDYVTGSLRQTLTHNFSLDNVVVERRRLPLIADALASEECFLSGRSLQERKVVPEIESLIADAAGSEIHTAKWTFTPCEEESRIMPEINEESTIGRPHIFTREFQSKFE